MVSIVNLKCQRIVTDILHFSSQYRFGEIPEMTLIDTYHISVIALPHFQLVNDIFVEILYQEPFGLFDTIVDDFLQI